jgi:hypothetical protein
MIAAAIRSPVREPVRPVLAAPPPPPPPPAHWDDSATWDDAKTWSDTE